MSNSSEKRIAPRVRVLGHAQILAPTGVVNCVIRDLSDTGAKLGVAEAATIPVEFDLWLVQRKLKLRARLKWRRGNFAGVAFSANQPLLKVPQRAPGRNYILDV